MEKRKQLFKEPFDLSKAIQSGGFEEALTQVVQNLSEKRNIRSFSELTSREILALTSLASVYKENNTIQEFVNQFCIFKVSMLRKGRGEMVTVGKSFATELAEERKGLFGSIKSKLFGK